MVTQNGMPFALGRRAGGWFARRARLLRVHAEARPEGTLRVDLGAGRSCPFKKLGKRKAGAGGDRRHLCLARLGAVWDITGARATSGRPRSAAR